LPYKDDEIDLVIISHYHPDHVARLKYFTKAKFLAWGPPTAGLFTGFNAGLMPENFYSRATFVELSEVNEWGKHEYKINDKMSLVKLDGHSNVHCGLLIDNKIFFIADAVWTRATYRENAYPSFLTKVVQESNEEYYNTIETLKKLHMNYGYDIIPSHCPEIIEKMRGKGFIELKYNNKIKNTSSIVLVTGASGFLGKNVVEYLASNGFVVVGCGRKPMIFTRDNIFYEEFDIRDKDSIDRVMEKYKPTFVVHCAALCKAWGEWSEFFQSNVVGTKNMLDSSIDGGVKRFIHISSPSVYLNNNFRGCKDLKENYNVSETAQSNYNKSKTLAEYEVMKILPNSEMETIILRPRGIYGRGDTTLLPQLKERISRIPYLGSNMISLTYVDNVSHSIMLALTKGKSGSIYNITDQQAYDVQMIIEKIRKQFKIEESYINKIRLNHWIPKYMLSKVSSVVEYVSGKISREPFFTPYTLSLLAYDCTLSDEKAQKELEYYPIFKDMIDQVLTN
jgi:dTDP-4-dehydrorhamnose 3,5-epimerase